VKRCADGVRYVPRGGTRSYARRFFVADWIQIKEEYISGGTSYRKLALRHGVSLVTLSRRAKKECWVALREEREHAGQAPFFDEVERNSTDVAVIADKLLARLSELVDVMLLDTQGIRQVASALKELRELKEYHLESALLRAKLRKMEREVRDEGNSNEITVVFDAGEEAWNE
jgi:transposase-like protein